MDFDSKSTSMEPTNQPTMPAVHPPTESRPPPRQHGLQPPPTSPDHTTGAKAQMNRDWQFREEQLIDETGTKYDLLCKQPSHIVIDFHRGCKWT